MRLLDNGNGRHVLHSADTFWTLNKNEVVISTGRVDYKLHPMRDTIVAMPRKT